MKPIEAGFESPRFLSPLLIWGGLGGTILLVLIMTGVNYGTWLTQQRHFLHLEKRVTEERNKNRPQTSIAASRTYNAGRLSEIKASYQALRPLIQKDMLDPVGLLDIIEDSRPDAVMISQLTLDEGLSLLQLKGVSPDAQGVSDFLTALKKSRRIKIDSFQGSVAHTRQFHFEIEAHGKDVEYAY